MIERWQVQDDPRHAGMVQRYHTWPTLQRQSVGEHTWQMFRIYYQIWGEIPSYVTAHLIWHDAGELHTGDVPFGAKATSKAFHAELDRLEAEAVAKMAGKLPETSERYQLRIKVCDLVEMWEFGHTEYALGNTMAQPIMVGTIIALDKVLAELDGADLALINAYMKRRKEFFGVSNRRS